jgi:hypothetical protein
MDDLTEVFAERERMGGGDGEGGRGEKEIARERERERERERDRGNTHTHTRTPTLLSKCTRARTFESFCKQTEREGEREREREILYSESTRALTFESFCKDLDPYALDFPICKDASLEAQIFFSLPFSPCRFPRPCRCSRRKFSKKVSILRLFRVYLLDVTNGGLYPEVDP